MLSNYTEKQLQDELKRREAKKRMQGNMPKPLEEPDDSDLREVCAEYLTEQVEDIHDTDTRHFIFEAALEMVYGKDVWNWLREIQE